MSDSTLYTTVTDSTKLTEDPHYVVIASFKDGDGDAYVKHGPVTYDEAASYAERNESEDNIETYRVAISNRLAE